MATLLLIVRQYRRPRNSRINPYSGTVLSLEADGLVGYVQCKKDTYKVLRETITVPLNASLQRIIDLGSSLSIYRDVDSSIKMTWGRPSIEKTVLASAPVSLFLTGDLAFYAIVLGKENMSPHWCWRCMLQKKAWTEDPTLVGEPWSHDTLKERLTKLQSGELDKNKASDQLGVTAKALFPTIPVQNILVPPLHNNELFINHPIKSLIAWINHRIEKLPLEIVSARAAQIDAIIRHDNAVDELAMAEAAFKALDADFKALKPKKVRGSTKLVFRDEQHKTDYNETHLLCQEAKEYLGLCSKDLSATASEKKATTKALRMIEKKKQYGALSQPVCQRMEEMLQRVHKIVRSAYHGGDFEGNHCRKFMRNADKQVMNDIQQLLLGVPLNDRAADNEEISKYCKAFKRLFQYFDLLIHYCQQPFGKLTDADMKDVRSLVGKLDRLWRRMFPTVPPKAHAWHHLLVDLDRLRGLMHHQESKIKVSHQVGRRIDLLFRSVNDVNKKIDCSLLQHTMEKSSMQQIQKDVAANRSRGKKRKATAEDEEASTQRNFVLNAAEIEDEFPSLIALAVADTLAQ